MRFDSFAAFMQMEGHGLFVWSCYAITLLVLIANIAWPLLQQRRMLKTRPPSPSQDTTPQTREPS